MRCSLAKWATLCKCVEETGDLMARADGSQGGMGGVVPFDSVVRRGRELIMD